MRRIKRITQTITLSLGSLLVAFAVPLSVYAEAAADTVETPVATSQETTPTETELAAEAVQAPAPVVDTPAETTTPPAETAPPKTYTYDEQTQRWNTDAWVYDPTSGKYEAAPAPAPVVAPAPLSVVEPNTTEGGKTVGSTAIDNETTAAIANALDSVAKSGDASVLRNTIGGDATTGNAAATATIINNVNSSMTNANNKQAATFVTDVIGDVNGDITLQPMLLKAMLEAGSENSETSKDITSKTSNAITNDINLSATSGDATVAGNAQAGNATTGSANTVADVVNIVNSMVAANQSFVGTVNIYGNLNGDILIAPDFIPQLLASNLGGSDTASSTQLTSTDTQSIVNNIALAAESGQALVEHNSKAGNATTGDAQTNTVIFNLTGREIVASNSLLVFVNVLGTWVGVIVDAPVGATAAALGSGVASHSVTPDLVIDATTDTQITNNITLASKSGDASVVGNTQAGSATTGDATASANIANISNSQVSLAGWFGILFINVFGNWNGSLGIDTDAGNAIVRAEAQSAAIAGGKSVEEKAEPVKVMSFIPRTPFSRSAGIKVIQGSAVQTVNDLRPKAEGLMVKSPVSQPLGTAVISDIPVSQTAKAEGAKSSTLAQISVPVTLGALLLTGLSVFGLRKLW